MKRGLILLLAAVFMTALLTACGRKDDQQSTAQNDSAVTNHDSDSSQSSSDLPNNHDTDQNDRQFGTHDRTDSHNRPLLEDAGDMIRDGVNDVENALDDVTGSTKSQAGGSSYQQMLKNAKVHDRDGNLKDLENSVSSGPLF